MSATPRVSLHELVLCVLQDDGSHALAVKRQENDDDTKTTLFRASAEEEDRVLDVVRQNWKLSEFNDNPVILDNHIRTRVVGFAQRAWVPRKADPTTGIGDADVGSLHIRVQWDLDNPDRTLAAVGYQHLARVRRAGSVGFASTKRTRRDKLASDHPWYSAGKDVETPWGPYKMHGTYHDGPILREFSSATIPALGSALQKSLVEAYAEMPLDDVERRAAFAGETGVPAGVTSGLVDQVKAMDATARAELASLLYPDLVNALRADPKLGTIVRAALEAGRQPIPTDGDANVVDFMSALAANLQE